MFKVKMPVPEIKRVEIMIKVPDKARECDPCFDKWLEQIKEQGNTISKVDKDKKEVYSYIMDKGE